MKKKTLTDMWAHAKREFPKESCGVVVVKKGKEKYIPCRNIAQNQKQFIMSPEDYAAADGEGDIVSIVHSHCNEGPEPSPADLVACENSGVEWHILALPNELMHSFKPSNYRAPYVGRPFYHGVIDCFSLVRDWYKNELDIDLPDIFREEDWWKHGKNLYMDNFASLGFEEVDPKNIQRGDVILMAVASKVPNHAAIYLGHDIILHHIMRRLSCRDIWGGYWRKHARLVVRKVK